MPLDESDNFMPAELSSSNQVTNLVCNPVHNPVHNSVHAPLHNQNSLNSFDHSTLTRDRQSNERGQYHPLTVDLPPAYNDIIK